jgi:hypothetical protein
MVPEFWKFVRLLPTPLSAKPYFVEIIVPVLVKPNNKELLWYTPPNNVELIVKAFVMVVDGNEEEIDK